MNWSGKASGDGLARQSEADSERFAQVSTFWGSAAKCASQVTQGRHGSFPTDAGIGNGYAVGQIGWIVQRLIAAVQI